MDKKLKLKIKLKSKDDLDNLAQYIVTKIKESILLASLKINSNNKKYPFIEPPFFIEKFIAEKRRERRICKQTVYSNDKHNILNNVIKRLKNELSNIDCNNFKKPWHHLTQITAHYGEQPKISCTKKRNHTTNLLSGKFFCNT